MSKETYELISKLHAKLSDAYESLAAEDDATTPPPDDDLPPPKKAGTAGKPKAKPKATAVDDEVTEQDIIAAAGALIKATDRNTAVKIIKKHGAEKIADIEAEDYPKVLKALKAAMPDEGADDI